MSPRVLALACIALLLAGCASPSRYPSLEIREAERASGTLQPAEPEPYVPPATPATVLDRLGQLTAEADSAHQAFLAAADRARGPVAAADGAEAGSAPWSIAQIALADLEAGRSQAMVALADLDRLYIEAELAGGELARIEAVRDQVSGQVESEGRLIAEMQASLGG